MNQTIISTKPDTKSAEKWIEWAASNAPKPVQRRGSIEFTPASPEGFRWEQTPIVPDHAPSTMPSSSAPKPARRRCSIEFSPVLPNEARTEPVRAPRKRSSCDAPKPARRRCSIEFMAPVPENQSMEQSTEKPSNDRWQTTKTNRTDKPLLQPKHCLSPVKRSRAASPTEYGARSA